MANIHLCEYCEKEFDRDQLEILNMPDWNHASLSCKACSMSEQVSYWRLKYEANVDTAEKMKIVLNQYRTCLLLPQTMEQIAATSEPPNPSSLRTRLSSLEDLSLDATLYWLGVHELYTKQLAENAGKKATKEEIQKHLEDKTKKTILAHKQMVEKQRIEKNDDLVGEYTILERKTIKSLMKSLKITEELAATMISTKPKVNVG